MIAEIERTLQQHRPTVFLLMRRYLERNKPLLLRSDLVDEFESFCNTDEGRILRGTVLDVMIHRAQEAVVQSSAIYVALRSGVARWVFVHIDADTLHCREADLSEFLAAKENLVDGWRRNGDWVLEVDLGPFERDFPRLRETRSIGRGVDFLNRHLSGRLFEQLGKGDQRLFDFLRLHQVQGQQLMLNGLLRNLDELRRALREALALLGGQPAGTDWRAVEHDLRKLGFEPGWGDTTDRITESMGLLSDILEAPSPDQLALFLARIPMIFSIVILSPHGYFGQANVLGKPDTGGQVVYILDQVRALEQEMYRSIRGQGLDIEPQILVVTRLIPEADDTGCDRRTEPITGTRNARILRVPFRDHNGEVIPQWISRFKIWPYLERFAGEVEKEIQAELGGRPALIVGNYSDGNLVASLLSRSLGVTQCNIAHALEKSKYVYSDLYWRDHEQEHSFACQYTADFIAARKRVSASTRVTARTHCPVCIVWSMASIFSIPSSTLSRRAPIRRLFSPLPKRIVARRSYAAEWRSSFTGPKQRQRAGSCRENRLENVNRCCLPCRGSIVSRTRRGSWSGSAAVPSCKRKHTCS